MTIDGLTRIIAHIGYPTTTFKSPMIYNPYFEKIGLNACVVPMGVKQEDFAAALPAIVRFTNFHGALITMPHKVEVVRMLDRASTAVKISGACNALRLAEDGALVGDMFDGEGFVRGLKRKGRAVSGAAALVVGSGGVGSAIAASLAQAGASRIGLFDTNPDAMHGLASRIRAHYPSIEISIGSKDPAGYAIAVNATPLGMNPGDEMPFDVSRLSPDAIVGEVVLKNEITPFLAAARAQGCAVQVGVDMLFEQIPAYLEFFGFLSTSPDVLREVAQIAY